jgi:hypothetical protein
MFLSLLAGALLHASGPLDFYADGPYDSSVPRPESFLHYGPGERITNYRDQERVVLGIAEKAKTRVKVIQFGSSVEGRPLRIFAISSPENIAHLDDIRKNHELIANGQADEATIKKTPPILWVNECIHGNEPASFESGMYLIYNLAASKSKSVTDALSQAVVIVNPVYNPDGHERFAVWYDSVAVGSSDSEAYERFEPSVIAGRLNHYRFDMNRDRVAMTQDETRAEVAEFLKWNPQVYADQHGQVESYFFPPNPMSVNVNVDRSRLNHWTEVFGRATGKAFDAHGMSYFIKDEFDLFYPGYLDSFTTLTGAIGMTHETDGGKELNKQRADGSILALRSGVEKHFTSAMALVRATADNRMELMRSYADFKKKAVTGESAGKFKRVVLVSEDPRPLHRLQTQLALAGVKSAWNKSEFSQPDANGYWDGKKGTVKFPANSLVVDIAQPQGAYAKTVLEPGVDFEPEFVKAQQGKKKTAPEGEKYPGPEGAEFYDMTGWSLPYAFNLKAWWCESAPKVDVSADSNAAPRGESPVAESTVGYALEYTDINDVLAVYDALEEEIHGSVTTKPMTLAGRKFNQGTFLFLVSHNEEDLRIHLSEIAKHRHVTFIPLTTSYPDDDRYGPGSGSIQALHKPSIGIIFGRGSDLAEVGATWYLMDRKFHLPFIPISENALNTDLSRFTCIVAPGRSGVALTSKLRDWVSGGGSIVSLGRPNWALGSGGLVDLSSGKGEPQSLPGSLFRAKLDERSFLSYGYHTGEISVPIGGDSFYLSRKEGGSVITLDSDPKVNKLLSGWEYPDDTEKNLAGTVWLQDVPVGRGHAVLFMQDPIERAMWPGLEKLLLNAMLMGTG